ncbi:C4-hydroxylase [[Emmonsia] crescens]|uniref:C4-hydroxylase n=1 Tax=[Emmonsia] crescens TaxID=73230 RepID=A0A0G2J6A1_9EURO|nr:C4-hydroxylase [Emmonsia crescens UAMH 3008]
MANATAYLDLPPLPAYTLTPREPLIPPLPDSALGQISTIIAYWAVSLIFHWIDVNDYFPQYRLHTPAEILKRNRVTRREVVRDVIVQQAIQLVSGVLLGYFDKPQYAGKDEYNVALWARRLRIVQHMIPRVFAVVGIDALGLAEKLSSYPMLAAAISGGRYPWLTQNVLTTAGESVIAPAFASWETSVAGIIYWYLIPTIQFVLAAFIMDTWQYFWHRAMHLNKWLYTTLHSRHHRLYVPYAFGALYNHPFEGFLLDTAGGCVAFLFTGMSTRQGIWFFTCSTIKTVDDHCGYAFPFDPLQHVTSNNAAYHDIHHQSWGIKTNFSQPFFTFWDRLLNTRWTGGDVTLRYERSRNAVQKLIDQENEKPTCAAVQANPISAREEDESVSRNLLARSVCRKTPSFSPQAEGLKSVSHRLNGSIRQK